jgi:dTDP-4-dehydrorhamnose reductase
MDEATTDLRDRAAVTRAVREARPDVVLHTAAYTAVDAAESDPETAFAVNEGGTRNLVEALRDTPGAAEPAVPLVYFSSDYVFDGRKGRPYVESDATAPLSVYGRSKLAGELVTLTWPAGIVVRTAWLFSTTGNNFVKTILRLAAERAEQAASRDGSPAPEPLKVVDDQVGSPTYAPHLAAGVLEVLTLGMAPGLWHMAGSGYCSWMEFAQEIVRCDDLMIEVDPLTTEELGRPAPRPPFSALISERRGPALPPWQDGVAAAVSALRASGSV